MQPELISLMQQLVTAVQSIALSVDVMSMDLRALNKNVALLAKRELSKDLSPLTLAPECSYSEGDDAASQVIATPKPQPTPGLEASFPFHHADFQGHEVDLHENSPRLRDSLREDIKRSICNAGMDSSRWKRNSGESSTTRGVGEGSTLGSGFNQTQQQQPPLQQPQQQQQQQQHQQQQHQQQQQQQQQLPQQQQQPQTRQGSSRLRSMANQQGVDRQQCGGIVEQGVDDENWATPTDGRSMNRDEIKNKKGKSFRCDWCGKCFPENYRLRNHMRVHTGERPFTCFQCGKAFAHKENLIVHGRVHSRERPFRCDICGKTFKDSWKLKRHRNMHPEENVQ